MTGYFPQVPIQVCTVVDTEREPIVSTVVGTEYKTGKKGKPKPSKFSSIIHKSQPFYVDVVYTLFNQNTDTEQSNCGNVLTTLAITVPPKL